MRSPYLISMLVILREKKRIQHGSKKEVSWGTGNHLGAKYWSLCLLNTISLVRSLFDHADIPSAAFLDEEDGKTAL